MVCATHGDAQLKRGFTCTTAGGAQAATETQASSQPTAGGTGRTKKHAGLSMHL